MDFVGLFSDIFKMSLVGGIPSIVVAALPFIIGLIIGYVLRKALKIGIILIVIAFIASYFGFVSLSSIESGAKALAIKYGPEAITYIAIFIGLLPLSLGLVIGIIIGFIF